MDVLLNGSDGIIDLAFQMGNGKAARRLLHGMEFLVQADPAATFMHDWLSSPERSKTMAKSLNER